MFPAASPEALEKRHPPQTATWQRVATAALVLTYAALQIALFTTHEAWRDEAQAWLWARDLSSLPNLLIVPGEGHPPGWFWLLKLLSGVLSFDQSRWLTVAVAILNAGLLARLLRRNFLLLGTMLASNILLQYWGYHFRPYTLVFTALLIALLLDQAGRQTAATWALVAACGLHFFSGLFFALWLLVLLQRRVPLRSLMVPSAAAGALGLIAIVSGMGNPAGAPKEGLAIVGRALDILAWPVPPGLQPAAVAFAVLVGLAYALRQTPYLLACLLALTLAYTAFGATIYGASEWHIAFLPMLAFMAITLAGKSATSWVLPVLLLPQVVSGTTGALQQISASQQGESLVYNAIVADAGPALDTATNLLAYPDYAMSASAARHDFRYRSAMNGQLMGPVNWRNRGTLDPDLAQTASPFWLACMSCDAPLGSITAAGLHYTFLAEGRDADGRRFFALRVNASN